MYNDETKSMMIMTTILMNESPSKVFIYFPFIPKTKYLFYIDIRF